MFSCLYIKYTIVIIYCVVSVLSNYLSEWKATNTIFLVLGQVDLAGALTHIYRIRGEHTDHYTTDAVTIT